MNHFFRLANLKKQQQQKYSTAAGYQLLIPWLINKLSISQIIHTGNLEIHSQMHRRNNIVLAWHLLVTPTLKETTDVLVRAPRQLARARKFENVKAENYMQTKRLVTRL